jgi:hypothetical protein
LETSANAAVMLTGLPLAGGFIVDGSLDRRLPEIAAGLVLVLLLGLPGLLISAARRVASRDE